MPVSVGMVVGVTDDTNEDRVDSRRLHTMGMAMKHMGTHFNTTTTARSGDWAALGGAEQDTTCDVLYCTQPITFERCSYHLIALIDHQLRHTLTHANSRERERERIKENERDIIM